MNKNNLIKAAITAFLTITTTSSALAAEAEGSATTTEKCYGVARAGMNDCSTATSSCASSSTKDAQADAFILLPKGICERIVNGSLKIEPVKPKL